MEKDSRYETFLLENDPAPSKQERKHSLNRDYKDDLKHLQVQQLRGVELCRNSALGHGYGGTIVLKAVYRGTTYAAKQVHRQHVRSNQAICKRIEQNFIQECIQHSKLHHPNIVKMIGIFYPDFNALPVLVMELMEYNLTQLVEKFKGHDIPMYIKLSVLQDVSKGICYLHAQNPPIVHCALYSDNILFTKALVAKISDFKTVSETDRKLHSLRRSRKSNDFLPESSNDLKCEIPVNIFSFGCIVCHVITQQWPTVVSSKATARAKIQSIYSIDGFFNEPAATTISEVEKRQRYIDLIGDNSLQRLVGACVHNDPASRPQMSQIHAKITAIAGKPYVILAM